MDTSETHRGSFMAMCQGQTDCGYTIMYLRQICTVGSTLHDIYQLAKSWYIDISSYQTSVGAQTENTNIILPTQLRNSPVVYF